MVAGIVKKSACEEKFVNKDALKQRAIKAVTEITTSLRAGCLDFPNQV